MHSFLLHLFSNTEVDCELNNSVYKTFSILIIFSLFNVQILPQIMFLLRTERTISGRPATVELNLSNMEFDMLLSLMQQTVGETKLSQENVS